MHSLPMMKKNIASILCMCLMISTRISYSSQLVEFSLARYSNTTVYANNSVIDINLVGEGFEGAQITDGGALECHTDDTTCCRGIDDTPNGMGRGEWYHPDGTLVQPPGRGDAGDRFYRTRGHMVIRLNRNGVTLPFGVYRCVIPGAGGVTITRYITLRHESFCHDLSSTRGSSINYTPPHHLSATLPRGRRYVGTIANYSCSPGYQLLVEGSVTACGPDGRWNGTATTCVVDCGPLTDPADGRVDTSSGTTFGEKATYSCDTGYTIIGGTIRICLSYGQWSGLTPACERKNCGPLIAPANGQVDTSSGTTFESKATYSCDTGYTLIGDATRTCESNGLWSRSTPTCKIKNCGPLINPANGQVDTSSGTTFESTATYSCSSGYSLIGDANRTCGSDGLWSGSTPTCDPQAIIQLKFGPTIHCIHWNEAKATAVRNNLQLAIYNAIAKSNEEIPVDNIEDGVFSCRSSQNYTTFRTTISGTERTSASRAAAVIREWATPGPAMRVEWYLVDVMGGSCPVVVDSLTESECLEEDCVGRCVAVCRARG